MRPIFNVPGEGAFALIMGIISGYPVGAKIVANLKEQHLCSDIEAERLIAFTNNSGPLFIIGTVGVSMFSSVSLGMLLFLSSLFSCQQKGDFESMNVEDFDTLIQDEGMQRLDVRTLAEYSEGHIAKTININVMDDSFSSMADSLLQKDRPVAVYCRSGKRSKKAAAILSKKGYKVFELDKGFNSWQEAGKEIEK